MTTHNTLSKTDNNMQQSIIFEPEPQGRIRDTQLHVVGCRYYITDDAERQKFLADAPKLSMFMACEPTNPYDPQAIAVYVNAEPFAKRVAYISTENLAKAHGILDCYNTTWMPIHALGLQPGRHTTLVAYPLDSDGNMIMGIEEIETPDDPQDTRFHDIYLTVNQYGEKPADSKEKNSLDEGIKEVAKYIEEHKTTVFWSDVYYFLVGKGIIDEDMSAAAFGKFIEKHGGPSAQKVRKSGTYQLSTNQQHRRGAVISSLSAFIRGI